MAAVLAAAFLAQEISYAAPSISMPTADPLSSLASDPLSFQAPVSFSDLKEVHQGSKDTLILHIQDAHTNLSGQQNLAFMLDEIMKKYPVSLVLVEGSSVDSTLTPIKEAVPAETVKRVAKSLLMEGQIAGEEYLNLISDHPMKIMGIEDLTLYMKSVLAYAELVDRREAIEEYLREVQNALEKLKSRLYPQDLKDLEKEIPVTPGGNGLFTERFDKLFEIARDNKVDLGEFKELEVLRGLKDKEKGIDFDAANMEQAVLVQKLGAAGLAEHLKNAGRIRNQRVAQYAVYREVADAAMNANVPLSSYPNFSAYGEYLKAFTNLNLDAVLNEETQAEDKIYASVLKDTDARLVRSIDRYTGLLKTAFAIKMSSDEFKQFVLNEPDFSTPAQLAFINRKLAEQGYFEDLLPVNDALEKGKQPLNAFYRSVADRDEAFIANTEKALAENNAKVAVLISGGYHTAHLKELFQKEGYSYAVMTPVVSSETNQAKYEKLLLSPIRGQSKKVETVQGERYARKSATHVRPETLVYKPGVLYAGLGPEHGARLASNPKWKILIAAAAVAAAAGMAAVAVRQDRTSDRMETLERDMAEGRAEADSAMAMLVADNISKSVPERLQAIEALSKTPKNMRASVTKVLERIEKNDADASIRAAAAKTLQALRDLNATGGARLAMLQGFTGISVKESFESALSDKDIESQKNRVALTMNPPDIAFSVREFLAESSTRGFIFFMMEMLKNALVEPIGGQVTVDVRQDQEDPRQLVIRIHNTGVVDWEKIRQRAYEKISAGELLKSPRDGHFFYAPKRDVEEGWWVGFSPVTVRDLDQRIQEQGKEELLFIQGVGRGKTISEGGGHGLALPKTREFVEDHGGSFKVESDEKSGTTVSIRLPIAGARPLDKLGARLAGIELPPWISADTVQDLRAALSAEEFSDMSAAQKEQIIEIAGTLRAPWFESSLVEFQDLIRPVLVSDSMTREERSRWSARVERISALIRDLDDKRRQSTETADLSRLVALVLIGRPVLHGYQMSFYVNGRGPFAVNEAIEELWQTPNVVAFTSRDPASDMALVLTELAENAYLKGREKDPATPVVVRIENDSLSVTNPGKYPFDKLRRAAAKNGVVRWKGELIDAGYWEMININNNQAEVLTPAQIRDKSVISDDDIPGIQGLTVREDEDLKDGEKELGEHAGLGGSLSALMPKDWGAKTTIRNSKDGKFVTATITFKKAGARLAAKRKPADAVNPAVTLEAARKANDWEIFQKERFTANLAGSLLRSVPVKAEDTVTDLPIADLYPTQIGLNAVKKAMEEIKGRIRAKFGLTAPQALVIEIPIYADEFSNAFVPVRFVMDGHHRISDALSRGQKTIRARYIRIAGSRDSGVRSLSASYKIWYDRNKIFKDTAERWKKLTIDTESVPEGLYFLISFIWGQADPAIAETMRGLLPQLSEPEKDQYRLKAAELLSGKDAPAPMTPEAAAALVRTAGARLAANGADQRKDTKFRSAVDEAVKSIRDRIRRAARQTAAARRLLRNLKAGNPSDRRLLQALGRSLEDRDFVSRLEKAATPGRRVVIISHGGLKEDNTIFGEHDTNVIIAKRQELTEKLLRAKPISHGYKTDRFAADEEFTPERLKALQSRLDSDMKTFILETFPDKVSPHLKGLSAAEQDAFIRRLFRSSIGVSLPVMSAETVSIADFEAVQAAKNEGGAAVYSHDALQRRVNEGIKLAAVMGINEDRIPSAAEILEARTQMQSGSTPADERQAALIRLLNIADLLEYPDPTDLNAEMRERRRAVSALAGLFMRSDPRSPPSAADIEKAIEYLRTDVQDPGILEPGAFHIEAARSPDTLVSADASGFYAVVAAEKLKALFRFARSTRRPMDALTAAAEAENAVQEIKRKLVRDLKDSIERITGQPITHITRSSGDEITLLAPGLRPEHYSALGNASYEIGLRITVSPRIMGERKARMRHAIAFAAASAERIDTLLDAVDGDSVLKEAKQILDQPKRRGGLVIAERDPKTNWQLFKAYLSVSDGAPVTEFGLNLEGTSRRIDRPTVSSRSAARLAGDRNLTDTQRQLLERLSGLSDTAVMRALTPEDYQTLREMSSAMTYQHRSGRAGVDDTEEPGVLDVLAYYRAAYPELSSAQSGARLSDSSFKFFKQIYSAELTSADISAADKALALADRESRILLAQIHHAKVLKGPAVPFLLTQLGRNASVGFSADGSEANLYDRNGELVVTLPLADVMADAVAALDKRPANTRVLNAQAAQVFEPAVQEGSLMRAAMKLMNGLRSSGQLSDNAVLLRFKMPANTEHRRLILSVKAFIQKMDANTFFEFSNVPELSDTVPAAPDLVRVDVDTAPSLEEGHRFLAIQPAADDAGAEEVLPYAATFIAAILIGRLKADAASESGSNLIGFFKRLTQENFSVDDLANYLKPSRNASYRSIKRLGKIAIDQFLGYAAAALRAIGSAA